MTTTMSLKSPSPKTNSTTSRELGIGAIYGVGAGIVVCAATWLSPLAAADRSALALIGVSLSLPLGALSATRPSGLRECAPATLRALTAGATFAAILTIAEPALWARALLWCCPAALIGAALAGMHRAAGVVASVLWLILGGLPFFYGSTPLPDSTAETWALSGAPWLGFSQDAFGGDPLRRPVLYMGRWSDLTDKPAAGLLTAGTLWIAAALSLAALMLQATFRNRPNKQGPTPTP
jgi:hypothetical protein